MYVVIFLNFFILYLSATNCTTSITWLGDSLNSFRAVLFDKVDFDWFLFLGTSKKKPVKKKWEYFVRVF